MRLCTAKGCPLKFLIHPWLQNHATVCETLPIHIISNTININISMWNLMQGIKHKNMAGARKWRAEESLEEFKVGKLVSRDERLMSLLSRSCGLVCTCYNNVGHTVPAGPEFAPMMLSWDTIANVHTTIKSIATDMLQNSSQTIKEEESCFFPPWLFSILTVFCTFSCRT